MSTTGVTTWAVDLKDVGAIYPFQGTEGIMVLIAVVLWIGWHVWQIRWENDYHQKKIEEYGKSNIMRKALDSD